MPTRQRLLSAGSRVAILENSIGPDKVLKHIISTIYHFSFGRESRASTLIIVDMRLLPQEREEMKTILYNIVVHHAHPKVLVSQIQYGL